MSQQFTYIGACTHIRAEDLTAMVDQETPVTWGTFKKHVGINNAFWLCKTLGYAAKKWLRGTLRIEDDPCVSFSRSKYRGHLCYFCTWSAIEFIFVAGLPVPEVAAARRVQAPACYPGAGEARLS